MVSVVVVISRMVWVSSPNMGTSDPLGPLRSNFDRRGLGLSDGHPAADSRHIARRASWLKVDAGFD